MAWEILRTVVEDIDVSNAVDEASQHFERLQDAWEALKWLLARNPMPHGSVRRMVGTDEYRLYVAAGDPVANTPDMWVVYRYSELEVIMMGMIAVPRVEEE